MLTVGIRIALLVIGYGFGLIQTGYLYGKTQGIDIRTQGSGNAGATNSLRVLGKKAGIIVFFGDALKCLIPCLIVRLICNQVAPEYTFLYMLYMAFGVTLGHNFPVHMGFRGGKGIACMGGLSLAFHWGMSLICIIVFGGVVALTKYVSVGSMSMAVVMFIAALVAGSLGWLGLSGALLTEFYILAFIIMALSIWQHRANIGRLMKGTENKVGQKKK